MNVSTLLEDLVAKIAAARQSQRKHIGTLLGKVLFDVRTLRTAKDLFSDQLAPDFRIFDYLCTNENGLSYCFRDLLDPRGKHGQKRLFLDIFLKRIGGADWTAGARCLSVEREKRTNKNRRIDVYLEFDNGLIGIENKPWDRDGHRQLWDYAKWLRRAARHRSRQSWLLVYLSNSDPDPCSISLKRREQLKEGRRFVQMNYHEAVEWLEEGAAYTKAPTVRVFVDELVKFIRTNINSELDMSEELQIKETLLASSENLEAAFLIAQSLDAVKRHLISKLKTDIESGIKPPYSLLWGGCDGSRYSGFSILLDEKHNKTISFEFDGTGFNQFCWGIARRSTSVTKNQQQWSEIYDIMNNAFVDAQQSEVWPWWAWASQAEFDKNFQNWSTSFQPWQAIHNGSLGAKIIEIAGKVNKAFNDLGRIDVLMP